MSVKEDGQIGTINDKIQRIDTLENFTVLLELDDTVLESILQARKGKSGGSKENSNTGYYPRLTKKNLMDDNIAIEIASALQVIEGKEKIAPLEPIAVDILQKVIKPNSRVDEKATSARREAYIESYIMENPVIIYKDERIISKDDIVTEDKFEVLKELNYIDSEGKPDYLLYISVFLIIFILFIVTFLYIKRFHPKVYYDRNSIMLICVTILITTFLPGASRSLYPSCLPL